MFRYLLHIAFIFSTALARAQKSYDGAQVILIPSEAANLVVHQIKNGGAETWRTNETYKEIFVTAAALREVRNILDINHVAYTVLTPNVQDAINKEHFHKTLAGKRMIEEGKSMSWDTYHRVKDIYSFTDQLAKDYPERVRVVNIGKSVQGRQIKVAIFKSGKKNAKKIWIDGGIHAREWITPAAVTFVMKVLAKVNASDSGPLGKIDFYVCPIVNPDGYEYSHTTDRLWRKNRHNVKGLCQGVDLNRNFKPHWKPAKKCNGQYPGLAPLSEPETKHMANFIMRNLDNIEGFMSFHAYSQVVLYPYAHAFKPNSDIPRSQRYRAIVKVGEDIARKISLVDGHQYKSLGIFNFTSGAYGSSVDWAMDIGIKYPFAIELRPSTSSEEHMGFTLPPNQIIPAAKESLAAITVLASAILKD